MTSLFPLGTGTGVAVAVDHAMLECRFDWVLVQVVVSVIDPPTLSRESILMASFPACKVTDSECAVEVVKVILPTDLKVGAVIFRVVE